MGSNNPAVPSNPNPTSPVGSSVGVNAADQAAQKQQQQWQQEQQLVNGSMNAFNSVNGALAPNSATQQNQNQMMQLLAQYQGGPFASSAKGM
jgi:hypothetical protein